MDITLIFQVLCGALTGVVAALGVVFYEQRKKLSEAQGNLGRERFARRSMETELQYLRRQIYNSDKLRYAPAPSAQSSGIVKSHMPAPQPPAVHAVTQPPAVHAVTQPPAVHAVTQPERWPQRQDVSMVSLADTSSWSTPSFAASSSSSDCSSDSSTSNSDSGSCSSGD